MQFFFFAILLKDLKIYVEFTDHIGFNMDLITLSRSAILKRIWEPHYSLGLGE